MKATIRWHLKSRKWFIIWWIIGIVFLIGINVAFYPSFKDQAGQLEQSFSQIPESARAFISDSSSFFTPEGYLSSQIFYLMLPMLLTVMTIVLGSSLLAREEKEGTLDMLLSKPMSRGRLLASKAMSGTVMLGIIGAITTLSISLFCWWVNIPISLWLITATTLVCMLFAFTVGATAFALTAAGSFGRAASVGFATLFALGGYVISSLTGVASWLKVPAKLFPFYYYRPSEVLTGNFNWWNILYFVTVIAFCSLLSFTLFTRRDVG